MRETIFAAVAAAILISASAASAVPTWAESYGVGAYLGAGQHADSQFYGSGDDYPVGIARMPDGGVVVAGQMGFPYNFRDGGGVTAAALVRFAVDGTILWQRSIDIPITKGTAPRIQRSQNTVYQIATDAQGNIFLCGGKGNPDNSGLLPYVAKFSPAGSLIWQNGISRAFYHAIDPYTGTDREFESGVAVTNYMALTPDGGVVITLGQGYVPYTSYTATAIAKFNADGTLGMYNSYTFPQQYSGTVPVAVSKDGSKYVMVFGYPQTGSFYPNPHGMTLLVVSSAGSIIAQRSFPPDDGRIEFPSSIIGTSDGGFAVLSVMPDNGFVVRKLNPDLSAESFEKIITDPNRGSKVTGISLAEASDGTLLIGGHKDAAEAYSGQPSASEDAMIMKLNADGTPQFVSLLGGPRIEGGPAKQYAPETGAYLVQASDGGYEFAVGTLSYGIDASLNYMNWWVVKTDANRKVRGFKDFTLNKSLDNFATQDTTRPPANISDFKPLAGARCETSTLPAFNLLDPATFEAPNQPEVLIQASSPRILSSTGAEAVVGQRFTFHVQAGFFDSGKPLTYSATGLPGNFVIDAKTGIISGLAAAGSETKNPIAVTLQVTDGTDTATAILYLAITDGVPAVTVTRYDGNDAANPVLEFALTYAGQTAGRSVDIEASSDSGATWKGLPTGLAGRMSYDGANQRYVLNTTNYPTQDKVNFRAVVRAPGRSDVISNIVGPFTLTSSKVRAAQTAFRIIRNGVRADFDFRTTEVSPAPGLAVRVQTSRTPGDEGSWTDLANPQGNISAMKADDAVHFSLATNNLAADSGIYFRAVASANGFVDSLSNVIGPYTLRNDVPPAVTIASPSGGQDINNPLKIAVDASGLAHFKITASAQSKRSIAALTILLDGNDVADFANGDGSVDYSTNVIGVHVIEALAIDDLGVIGRGSSAPTYVSIVPARKATMAQRIGGEPAAAAASTGQVYNAAADGNWNDPKTWSNDIDGSLGVPGPNDFAVVMSHTVIIDSTVADAEVGALMINGGHINTPPNGNGVLKVDRKLTIAAGGMDRIHLQIPSTCQVDMVNDADFPFFGTVSNTGTWNLRGAGGLIGLYSFNNAGNTTFRLPVIKPGVDPLTLPPSRNIVTGTYQADGGNFANLGIPGLVGSTANQLNGHNGGSLIGNAGGTLVTDNGSGLISNDGSSLISNDGSSLIGNDGSSIISTDGSSILSTYGGGISGTGGAKVLAANMRAAGAPSGIVLNGGELNLTSTPVTGSITINNGVLSGSGIVAGDLTNNGGYISPGQSAGTITVTGNFAQSSNGTVVMEVGSGEAGQFDRLQVGGSASLAGKLDVRLLNRYVPLQGETFNVIGYAGGSGSLSSSSNSQVVVNPTGIVATVNPAKPNPGTGQPLNISTRMKVLTGDNVLIGGFIVYDPTGANASKKVLIRALGPSLPVSGLLADPLLVLHKSDGDVTNDNWKDGDTTQIPAGFAPSNDKESLIVATLPPGAYTAEVKGSRGETGIGLVEVYDLNSGSTAKLANISTRGFVDTGDNVMIGGFIVGGQDPNAPFSGEPGKVLVRGIGPSLGVAGQLASTTLELHDSNGAVISNEGWRATQESEIVATTIPPNNDKDSAILATLVPGAYTAILRGANDTTGIGLIEAYNLQ